MELTAWKPLSRLPLLSLLTAILNAAGAQAQATSAVADMATRVAQMRAQTGDRVTVHVFGEPTLTDASTVDEKGRIALPRIGLIQAGAMSIADLRDTIRARLSSDVLKDPPIEVSVLRRIVVSGEVMRPGVYFADLTSSIGEMIAQAGGLKETAKASKVFLL